MLKMAKTQFGRFIDAFRNDPVEILLLLIMVQLAAISGLLLVNSIQMQRLMMMIGKG